VDGFVGFGGALPPVSPPAGVLEPDLVVVLGLLPALLEDEDDEVELVVVVTAASLAAGTGANGLRALPPRWTLAPFVVSATGWLGLAGTSLTVIPTARATGGLEGGTSELLDPPSTA
jgi:hypothetical protein